MRRRHRYNQVTIKPNRTSFERGVVVIKIVLGVCGLLIGLVVWLSVVSSPDLI